MRRLIRQIVPVTLVLGVLLVSCAPSPAPAPAPTTAAYPSPGQVLPAYPSPAQGMTAYPSPSQDVGVYTPYPAPSEGLSKSVGWDEAVGLIQNGTVAKVYQSQTMHVTLVLKDGTVVGTMEPALDEVFKVIERCGDACKAIEKFNQ